MEHALRSCIVGVRLGEALGLGDGELSDIYYIALLRLVGCTADAHLAADVFGDELEARGWFAPLDWGKPAVVMGAAIRHIGAGEPPLQRAGTLLNAFAKMPKLWATATAH